MVTIRVIGNRIFQEIPDINTIPAVIASKTKLVPVDVESRKGPKQRIEEFSLAVASPF